MNTYSNMQHNNVIKTFVVPKIICSRVFSDIIIDLYFTCNFVILTK